jgi:hypothetical protein
MIPTALNIVPSLGVYYIITQTSETNPTTAVVGGGLAGISTGLIAYQLRQPPFPEARLELQAIGLRHLNQLIMKTAVGYAAMFTVYEGLTQGIDKARWMKSGRPTSSTILMDPTWHLSNFFAGGISGIAYRAASFPLYKGLEENPLTTKVGARLLASTFLQVGLLLGGASAIRMGLDSAGILSMK